MRRRQLLTGLLATPLIGAGLGRSAQAYSADIFSPALWEALSDSDQAVILNYRADWSLTCQIKRELLTQALEENAQYQQLRFIEVDWDIYARARVTEGLKVSRRSTLLLVKGGREVERLENKPDPRALRAFLDKALAVI